MPGEYESIASGSEGHGSSITSPGGSTLTEHHPGTSGLTCASETTADEDDETALTASLTKVMQDPHRVITASLPCSPKEKRMTSQIRREESVVGAAIYGCLCLVA